MHHALVAGALSLLAVSTVSTPAPRPTLSTHSVERPAPTVDTLPAAHVAKQVQDRVEQYQELAQRLTERMFASPPEQRPAIRRQLHGAALQMRLDIFGYQLEYAKSSGRVEMAKKIEANMARLVEVSKNPQTVLRTEKAVRELPANPGNAKAARTDSRKSSFGKQGGDR